MKMMRLSVRWAKTEAKEMQTEEEKPKQDESTQTEATKRRIREHRQSFKDDISKMEKEAKELQEKLW